MSNNQNGPMDALAAFAGQLQVAPRPMTLPSKNLRERWTPEQWWTLSQRIDVALIEMQFRQAMDAKERTDGDASDRDNRVLQRRDVVGERGRGGDATRLQHAAADRGGLPEGRDAGGSEPSEGTTGSTGQA